MSRPGATRRDESALVALTRGSEADRRSALEGLHALYRDEVMGFLVHFLRDAALAEDVLQEAFLSAYSGFDRFDSSRPFRPWLYQIARNTALHALRSRRKEKRVDEKGARAEPASGRIVLQAQSGEEAERAREVLASLEDDDAALLVQRHGLGMKLEELAVSWSCTERTIRNRLRAAAEEFARALIARRGPATGGRP